MEKNPIVCGIIRDCYVQCLDSGCGARGAGRGGRGGDVAVAEEFLKKIFLTLNSHSILFLRSLATCRPTSSKLSCLG
jgi:hypothetical protein